MKPSLEEERRALLEQIEASRAVYRRLLAGEPSGAKVTVTTMRGRSVSWMLAHPLWVAGGVALLVLLMPRIAGGSRRTAARRPLRAKGGGTVRALLTVAALLLRNPERLRTATRFAASAWQWLQGRRHTRVAAAVGSTGMRQH